ncbi:MAG: hypothetical protein ACTIM6_04580, partial [Psychrobacter sp.]
FGCHPPFISSAYFLIHHQEVNSDYQGLIIDELQLSVNRLARFREELLFEIGIEPLYDNGGYIVIKVTRMQTGDTVATARLHFIGYDFQLNKTATLNNSIKEALYPHLFKI